MGFGAIRAKPQAGLAPGQEVNTEEVAVHEREFVGKFQNKDCRGLTVSLGQEVTMRKL